ncbi:MAG TPA: methyltransferase domain-containing protein [Anaerolineae bacterium]
MLRQLWHRLVRFGFRLLYNELAWTYDAVSWLVSFGEWRAWQRAALPFVAGGRVLELGHGTGHMLLALQAAGYEMVGLDVSPHMGRLARRRLLRGGMAALLVRGQGQALPFATASFDTVLATFPTDYIVDPVTLAAVHRVLRPGGRLVIVPEGHLIGSGLHHRFIDWLFRVTGQRSGPFAVDDERYWPDEATWQAFQQRFRAAGFDAKIHHVRLQRSGVTVVVAVKVR